MVRGKTDFNCVLMFSLPYCSGFQARWIWESFDVFPLTLQDLVPEVDSVVSGWNREMWLKKFLTSSLSLQECMLRKTCRRLLTSKLDERLGKQHLNGSERWLLCWQHIPSSYLNF
jgi:hypothetical protein